MAFDREAAKKAGYSDEEIDAYLQQQQAPQSGAGTYSVGNEPSPQEVLGTQQVTNDRPGAVSEVVAPLALNAGTGGDIAKYAAGAYGIYKGGQILNKYGQGIDAARSLADAQRMQAEAAMASEKGIQNRFDIRRGAAPAASPSATPGQPYRMTYNMPAAGAPTAPTAPVAPPAAAQAAPQAENWMSKAMNMAKSAAPTIERYAGAAGRALAPVAETLAPVANFVSRMNPYITAAQGITYSTPLGPKVPSTGPARGMEINPQTNAPWTPQELAAYQQQYPQ